MLATDDYALEPWGIALYRNGLYAVGRWEHETGPRVFAVERFTTAERRRRARFEVPADFSLGSFFGGAFGVFPGGAAEKIVLEFERGVAEIVLTRRYHHSQRTTRLRNGCVGMELTLPVTPDVVSWLVGWGPMVRRVEPSFVRAAVLEEHQLVRLAGARSGRKP